MVDDIPRIKTDLKPQPSLSAQKAVARATATTEVAKAELDSLESTVNQPQVTTQRPPPSPKSPPSPPPQGLNPLSRSQTSPLPPQPPQAITKKKGLPRWLVIILIILGVWVVLGIIIAIPALETLNSAKATIALARETYTAGKNQNLPEFNAKLEATKTQLEQTRKVYKILSWTQIIPVVGAYYRDGNHAFTATIAGIEGAQILGQTLEPYADVLGFQGQGSFTGGSAEDRITKIVETLDKITPEIDKVGEKIKIAHDEIHAINPNRYPFKIKNRDIKETVKSAQTLATDALVAVTDAKPVLQILPGALGTEKERKYAVIFQNDAEIRATGGFMTAYGILRLDKGKVYQEKSDDIYNLDSKFKKRLKPPELIAKYLPLVFYWNLRDMNLSPDFKESMDVFYSYYKDIPGEPEINGIIAVDTQVLNDLVTVLGPIDVPGYGTFTSEKDSRCDCPQIIYELEDTASRPVAYVKTDRKGFLAPMLQTILLKAYGSPKNMWPGLFETILRNIREKHVLFYLFDESEQQAIEGVNVAGRIQDYDADYLHVNDINFAGAKSNMFVTEEVTQEITVNDNDTVTKKVTLTYKNPAPASNCNLEAGELCLNGILRDVVRLYVPKGSQLQEALGLEEGTSETLEDLNKTVFQGFFTLYPENQAKIIFEYTVPYSPKDEYRLLIQKQPGKKRPHYTVTINQTHQEEFDLNSDRELRIQLEK